MRLPESNDARRACLNVSIVLRRLTLMAFCDSVGKTGRGSGTGHCTD